jgi:hypothetical protein
LRNFITKEVQTFLEVLSPRGERIKEVGVDSLNVSVAAAVAVQEVMGRMRVGKSRQEIIGKKVEPVGENVATGDVTIVDEKMQDGRMFTLISEIGTRENETKDVEMPEGEDEQRVSSG